MPLSNPVRNDIHITLAYESWLAAKFLGLDLHKWDRGEYGREFMVNAIAFHRTYKAVEAHSEEAKSREMKRKSKRGGRRR